MRIIQKIFMCFFFLPFVSCFAAETFQGELKNGMRYYICPDFSQREVEVSLVIKNSPQLYSLPFFDLDPFDAITGNQESDITLEYSLFSSRIDVESLGEFLVELSTFLNSQQLSEEMIEELRDEYADEKEALENKNFRKADAFLYAVDLEYTDKLFSQGDDALHKAGHAFFHPARMCLIITGPFDELDLEEKLETLFGEGKGDELFAEVVRFKLKQPTLIKVRTYTVADFFIKQEEDEEDEEEKGKELQEVDVYCYPFAPTLKNAVLNDLFFVTHFDMKYTFFSSSIGKLSTYSLFPFSEEVVSREVTESRFSKAKKELKHIYRNKTGSITEQCARHFLSEIPHSLELSNAHLLAELEKVSLKELQAFIKEHIKNVPLSGEFGFVN